MAVDYDLVIIGSGTVARDAAVFAAKYQARVALVEPPDSRPDAAMGETWRQVLRQQGVAQQQQVRASVLRKAVAADAEPVRVQQTEASTYRTMDDWARWVTETLTEVRSPAVLASFGVEWLQAEGQFVRRSGLALATRDRLFRSSAYLLCPEVAPVLPAITGLEQIPYWTPTSWMAQLRAENLPKQLLVIGSGPTAVELAQILQRLGIQVTIVTRHPHLLAAEDFEAADWVQAQLEAEGVQIWTKTAIQQAKQLQTQTWVEVNGRAIAFDAVLLAAGQQPMVGALNLEAVGVKRHPYTIPVNAKLQTTNPRIYACGNALGGYPMANLAQYEAELAVKNALFLPLHSVDYRAIPWSISTDPELARVGMTETEARQQYGSAVIVCRQAFIGLETAQVRGETAGFGKVIVHRNGEILGGHIVGANASELMYPLALAMQQRLKIQAIAQLPAIQTSLTALYTHIAAEWRQQARHHQRWKYDLFENWFNLKRAWSR